MTIYTFTKQTQDSNVLYCNSTYTFDLFQIPFYQRVQEEVDVVQHALQLIKQKY